MKTLKNIDVRSQNYFYDESLKLIAFYKYIFYITQHIKYNFLIYIMNNLLPCLKIYKI